MVDRLEQTAAVENHWLVFTLLGWENMAACVVSHYLVQSAGESGVARWPLAVVWSAQIVVALLTTAVISGRPRFEDSPLQSIVRRVAGVFVLLSCNVVVLEALAGLPTLTLLPVLATLSSFALLMLAAMISGRFVAAALTLFAAGGLMARFPAYGFLVYGIAWLVVLQGLGVIFLHKRRFWVESARPLMGGAAGAVERPDAEP